MLDWIVDCPGLTASEMEVLALNDLQTGLERLQAHGTAPRPTHHVERRLTEDRPSQSLQGDHLLQ